MVVGAIFQRELQLTDLYSTLASLFKMRARRLTPELLQQRDLRENNLLIGGVNVVLAGVFR